MSPLLQLPAIQQLPETLQGAFAAACTRRKLAHGTVFESAGVVPLGAHCALSGSMRMYSHNSDGERVLVSILPPNYWFGIAPMCDGGLTMFEVVASGPTEVLTLPKAAFEELLATQPAMQRLCLDWLSFKLRGFSNRIANAATLPLDQLLARQMLTLMEGWGKPAGRAVRIDMRLSHEDLAEMVGATRQRIHQIMHTWENQGVVGRDGKSITVLDTTALVRLTGVNHFPH